MLTLEAVLGGLLGVIKLISLLIVPIFGLLVRRKWRLAAASREEIRRLVIQAEEEAKKAEIEAEKVYYARPEYESSPVDYSFVSAPKLRSMCAVCYKPTTTRCSRCKSINYCSGKCQITHWRQGHKDECHPATPDSRRKDKTSSSPGIKKNDNSSLSKQNLFEEEDHKAHDLKNSLSDSNFSSPINAHKDIPKVEFIEAPLMTPASSDSSSVPTSPTCSTSSIPSESTNDALSRREHVTATSDAIFPEKIANSELEARRSSSEENNDALSRREHVAATSDAIFPEKIANSELEARRSSSNAHVRTLLAYGDIHLHTSHEEFESRTKKPEYKYNPSEGSSFGGQESPNSMASSTVDDHASASSETIKAENVLLHHGKGTKPSTISRRKADSTLQPIPKESPVFRSDQSKTNSLRSRSFSGWDFEIGRKSPDFQTKSQEVGSTSFRVSSNDSSGSYVKRNGMTNPISKVVLHFKTSKTPKNENALKHYSQMNFSYDMFFKLYNAKIEMRPFGLLNCGNSCYGNVVLQCLAFTQPLSAYLLQGLHNQSCSRNSWCFTCELESLMLKAKRGESVLNPASIMSRVHNIGVHLGPGREEDAHEFLRFAVDKMRPAPSKTREYVPDTDFMQLIFGGYIQSKIKCMNCQSKSVRNERMMDLTVGISGDVRTLQEALTRFTATEVLDGEDRYKCSRCKSYQKAKKRLKVQEAPNILTIALKRFQFGKFGKLNKPVTFPETLDMSDYMSSSSKNRDKSPIYQLYAVVVHLDVMNAAFSGHYVCYVRRARGKWYKIDDSMVNPVEVEKVLSETAYMLFYARRYPRNVPSRSEVKPKSKMGDRPPSALPGPEEQTTTPAGSESSDNSSIFSHSPSDDSSFATESTRFSSSTDDGGCFWSNPSWFSDDSDADPQTLNYGPRRHSGAFLDSDPGRDFRNLTLHLSDSSRRNVLMKN